MSVDTSSGGKGGKKSLNPNVNVVPFIDLMSVLIAFLLITAVWTNIAQMNVTPKGRGAAGEPPPSGEPPLNVSVLIGPNEIRVGLSDRGPYGSPIKRKSGEHDGQYIATDEAFGELYTVLAGLRTGELAARFADKKDIEIAADKGVEYQGVITTMDTAVRAGWEDVGFIPPSSLSARVSE